MPAISLASQGLVVLCLDMKRHIFDPVITPPQGISPKSFLSERFNLIYWGTLSAHSLANRCTAGLLHSLNSLRKAGSARLHSWAFLPLDKASIWGSVHLTDTLNRPLLHPCDTWIRSSLQDYSVSCNRFHPHSSDNPLLSHCLSARRLLCSDVVLDLLTGFLDCLKLKEVDVGSQPFLPSHVSLKDRSFMWPL